jgi:ERCC4-type nuclease
MTMLDTTNNDEIGSLLSAGFRLVDTREPNNTNINQEGASIRYELMKTGWKQHRLFYGDYAFTGQNGVKIGVTRKEVGDLLNSIGEVFAKQLDEMLDYYDINIFILEGALTWDPNTDCMINSSSTRFTREGILNYLHRWLAKGFILERSTGWTYTVKRLNELYALHQNLSFSARSSKWIDERVLCFPPSTRGKTAINILAELGSLNNVANSSVSDFLSIKGVGEKKAQLVYDYFHKGQK